MLSCHRVEPGGLTLVPALLHQALQRNQREALGVDHTPGCVWSTLHLSSAVALTSRPCASCALTRTAGVDGRAQAALGGAAGADSGSLTQRLVGFAETVGR